MIAADFLRFRPAGVLLYLHIPLSDIQSKECWLASLVEMSGRWTTGKWGVSSRQMQRKSFHSTQTGSGIRPASCSKCTGTLFRATGFTRGVKDVARSGLEHTHPSYQWVTGGSFREIQRRRHETDHTAIQRDLKKPVHISCVIEHFIVTC